MPPGRSIDFLIQEEYTTQIRFQCAIFILQKDEYSRTEQLTEHERAVVEGVTTRDERDGKCESSRVIRIQYAGGDVLYNCSVRRWGWNWIQVQTARQ